MRNHKRHLITKMLKVMLNAHNYKNIGLAIAIFIALQSVFAVATYRGFETAKSQLLSSVETRIAKDLSRLPISDESKKSAGNPQAIADYITKLNVEIQASSLEPKLLAIQSEQYTWDTNRDLLTHEFMTPNQTVVFVLSIRKLHFFNYVSLFVLLTSVVFYIACHHRTRLKHVKNINSMELVEDVNAHLVIDLEQKLLINSKTHVQVPLANKPLCFYTALIEYCISYPDVLLNQNKEVPEELLSLANKYFYRLTELGHTIRKRPNFSNSLEKTLSEIRAAIDEILQDEPELKELVFPPKAHGEGSRSKLHHYGLKLTNMESVEIIGK